MSIVLVGGTGTLGREIARQLSMTSTYPITIFSRDEFKQHEMRREFPNFNYVLGDVRDLASLDPVMRTASTVFLLAAIKHIEAAEQNPLEALKTNCIGAANVAESALEHGVDYVVYSNTDKAVLPITTYGYTKAWAQNLLLSLNGRCHTAFSVFNWGNIAGSRGSVIPSFVASLLRDKTVQVTAPGMSRFWMTIEQAAGFMLANYEKAPPERAMIPPVKAAAVMRIVSTIASILQITDVKAEITGLRGIEKLHEVLESSHDSCLRSDTCEQYTDAELFYMLRPIVLKEVKACASTFTGSAAEWANDIVRSSEASDTRSPAKTSKKSKARHLKVTPSS